MRLRRTMVLGLLIVLTACTATGPAPAPTTRGAAPTASGTSPGTSPGTPSGTPSAGPTASDGLDHTGPSHVISPVPAGRVAISDGIDWREPAWVRPAVNSGFFSEDAAPGDHVPVRSVDLSWRQVEPRRGKLDTTSTGSAQGMSLPSLDDQLAEGGPFWMRLFASGTTWAPDWVGERCGVTSYGPDDDGQRHLPIWDECVWSALLDTYRRVFVDHGLAADPDLRFVYVPGAFTWAEFDYDVIAAAAKSGDLDAATYLRWYAHAWTDLATLFGTHADKLVFTGEDYPFGPFAPGQQDLLAQQATRAGLGIRNGITEESNFHLSEAPAYGSHVQPDGHLVVDENLPIHDGRHVVATENECYDTCGYTTTDLQYAVVQSNLKALQLRVNWLYVVPADSKLAEYPAHWDWVRLSLGQTAATSADAWADLRDAADTYWADDAGNYPAAPITDRASWPTRPYVRNLERWVVQRDVAGGRARRSEVEVHRAVLSDDNGVAYEGLSTDVAKGQSGLYFDVDDRFAAGTTGDVQVKITFWDAGGPFTVTTATQTSTVVRPTGAQRWRTATLTWPATALTGGSTGGTDFAVRAAGDADPTVRLVRVVRLHAPLDR